MKIIYQDPTIRVKKVKVGTPVRRVTAGSFGINNLGGVDTTGQTAGSVLAYNATTTNYEPTTILGDSNITVTFDSDGNTFTHTFTNTAITGSLIPDSNEAYDLGSSSNKWRDLYLSGNTITLGSIDLKDSSGGLVVVDSDGNSISLQLSVQSYNTNIFSFDSANGSFTFDDTTVARVDTTNSIIQADSATLGNINFSGGDLTTTGKLYYANIFDSEGALPSASTYHGMFAHVHGTGRAYYAHAGDWVKLLDKSIPVGQGLSFDRDTLEFSITDTGVAAGTYGSASEVPVFRVNAQGQLDSAGTVSVAGVTSINFDSSNGNFTINTADGQTFLDTITLDPYTTNNLVEGTNLYYTTTRADSDFDIRLATKTTADVAEGTNLYYTTARADSDFDVRLGTKSTSNLSEGSNLYYTTARADSDAKASLLGGTGVTYDSSTGVIAIGQGVATTDNVTFNNLVVSGNLTVSGSTTTINTETIQLADNELVLNSNFDSGEPTENGGITIRRGDEASKELLWNETTDKWTVGSETFVAGTFEGNVTGNVTGTVSDISNHSTTDLSEGDNLYYTTARADSDAKNAISVTDAGGDGSLSYNPSTGIITYTGPSATEVRAHMVTGTGLTYDSSQGRYSITNTGVTAATYGSSSQVPVFTVNAQGQIDSAGSVAVAGVSSFSFDSANGNISIGTADGQTFLTTITLDPYSTSNLTEGTNLYYTTARADSDAKASLLVNDTGGDGSLSYDSATGVFTYTGPSSSEVRAHFSATGDLTYDSSTGVFSIDVEQVYSKANFDSDLGDANTGQLPEGTNLYYTTARADSDAKASLLGGTGVTYDSATGVIAIGQPVGTTDNVTFAQTTMDSAILDGINFNVLTSKHANAAGTLFFDSDHQKALSIVLDTQNNPNPDVTLNIGQEVFLYVHNQTGAAISNGDAVYISGTAHGKHPQVTKARANTSTTSAVFGLATMDIPDNAHGWVTRYGLVRDVNTGGMTAGNILFLSPDSDGVVTETTVTVDTGFPHHIGRVIVADSNNGVILVDGLSEHFDDLRVENKLKTKQLVADSASLLHVQFDVTTFDSHQPYSEGLLYYDNKHKTLNYNDDITGMVHEVGTQEHQRVFNNTGSLIRKGQPLYFSGNYTSGTIDVPTVGLADATDVNAYNAQGIAALDIPNNSYGHCLIAGQLTEVNTAGLSDGTNFFVGLGPGLVQNASPTYPNYPMCLGWVVNSGDSSNGILLVNQQNHSVNSFRVRTSAHIGTDLQVDGNLTILGSQTTVGQSNVTQGSPFYRLNEGDAIGEAGTTFIGSGLDDAFFAGHFTGTTAQTYYVRIDGVGTGAGGVDTFEVALGNDSVFASPILTKVAITGEDQLIHSADNISVNFGATTGHDSGDVWKGVASPVNVDTGFFTNRNTGTTGVGYTHMGLYFDVSDEKWKLVDEYDSVPTGTINTADSSFSLATLVADTFEGSLTGAVTGNASTASALATGRNFELTGQVTASAVSFDGTGNVTLVTDIASGVIRDSDINAAAAIADTKLATISTAGKVNNSATTATDANTGSTIVARDASGNFTAGTVTLTDLHVGNLHVDSADIIQLISDNETYSTATELMTALKTVDSDGSGLNAATLDGQEGTYYRINVYNNAGTLLN